MWCGREVELHLCKGMLIADYPTGEGELGIIDEEMSRNSKLEATNFHTTSAESPKICYWTRRKDASTSCIHWFASSFCGCVIAIYRDGRSIEVICLP